MNLETRALEATGKAPGGQITNTVLEALHASQEALKSVVADARAIQSFYVARDALEKIEKAYKEIKDNV